MSFKQIAYRGGAWWQIRRFFAIDELKNGDFAPFYGHFLRKILQFL